MSTGRSVDLFGSSAMRRLAPAFRFIYSQERFFASLRMTAARALDIQVDDVEGVFLDEFAALFDVFTIRVVKMFSAATTSSSFTCNRVRVSAFMVVSQSCSGFISPRPLKRVMVYSFLASSSTNARTSDALALLTLSPLRVTEKGGLSDSEIARASERRRL